MAVTPAANFGSGINGSDAEGWSAIADEYDITAASLTRRVALAAFLSNVDAISSRGATILDVATGTGALPLAAAEHFPAETNTKIIATDFAEGMIRSLERLKAEKGWQNVQCDVMDAQDLRLPDSSCQAVFCIAGVILMADGRKAVHEMKRVLSPRGVISFSTWKSVAGLPLTMEAFKFLEFQPPQREPGIPWHDREWLEGFMKELAFTDIRVEEVEAVFDVPDGELMKFGSALARNPAFQKVGTGMTESQKEQWPQAIVQAVKKLHGEKDTYHFQNVAYVVSGRKQ